MMPSSWQWQGAGQAAVAGPGWGTTPAHREAHSAAQSHSARSPGGLGISAAGGRGTWRAGERTGALAAASRLWVPRPGRRAVPSVRTAPRTLLGVGGGGGGGERGDGAVREGQALLSDLRYSVSQAGLGKGGRHRRRRSQGNFLRCGSLPFPPSFRAGRNFIQERKKKAKKP